MAFCRSSVKHLGLVTKILYRRQFVDSILFRNTPVTVSMRHYAKNAINVDVDNEKPVKFTTSEASTWKAEYSRTGEKEDDTPEAQPYIVAFSIAVFMVYFFILREENDIDMKLSGQGLGDAAKYLEYVQLKTIVDHNNLNNEKTDDTVLKRLKQLEIETRELSVKV